MEDVWKEIVAGGSERRQFKQEAPDEMMTLEDFLARAGAVDEDDVKAVPVLETLSGQRSSGGVFPFDHPIPASPFPMDGVMGFVNGVEVTGGRGKRRALLEPLDKAAQQRQRRMIKNRESAARSRERKQAYQIELESLAVKLEEENEQLLKEKAERTKERYKQLMEKIIPVVEEKRPARMLRRVRSNEW
uniref:BZIP protein 11 n=1 Tax=Lonicera japonica TaxID=105884 RepID=A0A4Y1JSF2_LONJA|nr:bZIP protein 11 [Lonicera japonica]